MSSWGRNSSVFKKKPPTAPVTELEETREVIEVQKRSTTVTIDIAVLTSEQLVGLINRHLAVRIAGLRTLAVSDLRKLYLALTHVGDE